MKTRQGFISNSSTSSFILVTSKEDHDQAIKQLTPEAALIIEYSIAVKKIGGQELIFLGCTNYGEGMSIYSWTNVDQKVTGKKYIDYYKEDVETYTECFSQYTALLNDAVISKSHS